MSRTVADVVQSRSRGSSTDAVAKAELQADQRICPALSRCRDDLPSGGAHHYQPARTWRD